MNNKLKLNSADKALLARMAEVRDLLAEFDCTLRGYEPGVSCLFDSKDGWQGESNLRSIDFNYYEWKWLEPLLKELRALRLLKIQAKLVVDSDNDNVSRAGFINVLRDMVKI